MPMKPACRIIGPVAAFAAFAIAGCGTAPTADQPAESTAATAEAASGESGLGTVAHREGARVKCDRRRTTGSNRRRSRCSKNESTQPVREVEQGDPAIVTGVLRQPTRPN